MRYLSLSSSRERYDIWHGTMSDLIPNKDNDVLKTRGRTSICRSTLLNFGKENSRVAVVPPSKKQFSRKMPKKRKERNYFPSSPKVLALLLKCFPLNGRNLCAGRDFATAFGEAVLTGTMNGEVEICGRPL